MTPSILVLGCPRALLTQTEVVPDVEKMELDLYHDELADVHDDLADRLGRSHEQVIHLLDPDVLRGGVPDMGRWDRIIATPDQAEDYLSHPSIHVEPAEVIPSVIDSEIEQEQKYLLPFDTIQRLPHHVTLDVSQWYIADPEGGPDVRVRRVRVEDMQLWVLTIKTDLPDGTRQEIERLSDIVEAKELLARQDPDQPERAVHKLRHRWIENGRLWELDEYLTGEGGTPTGLITLEHEGDPRPVPAWIEGAVDVTGDKRLGNAQLAVDAGPAYELATELRLLP